MCAISCAQHAPRVDWWACRLVDLQIGGWKDTPPRHHTPHIAGAGWWVVLQAGRDGFG